MLARAELRVKAEWREREYTTDPPRYTPYTAWSLMFSVVCETPIRIATVVTCDNLARWGLVRETAASHEVSAFFSGAPCADRAGIHFGNFGLAVLDAEMKADPKNLVDLHASQGSTGELLTLATISRYRIALQLIAFAPEDTQNRRLQKWRVRPRLADSLPPHLRAMTSGFQSGEAVFADASGP